MFEENLKEIIVQNDEGFWLKEDEGETNKRNARLDYLDRELRLLQEDDDEFRVKVVDARCGAGKSSFAIQHINSLDSDTKIIYITPFIKETERIRDECPSKHFVLPSAKKGRGSKLNHFYDLIAGGYNIASTHALFSDITEELIELLRSQCYILILDEVMNVVERLDIYDDNVKMTDIQKDALSKNDINVLIDKQIITVDEETNIVSWNDDTKPLYKYMTIKNLADRGLLYYIAGDLLIWTFPVDIFKKRLFDEIYILTYQFKYQIQAYYYDYFNIKYDMYSVRDVGNRVYELIEYEDDVEWRKEIAKLIDVCDNPKLNKIGDYYKDASGNIQMSALSKSWFDNSSEELITLLKKNMVNYFSNIAKVKSKDRMWTCFKAHKNIIKDAYVPAKCWIELNCRSSNEYANRNVVIYPINRYLNPFYTQFFSLKGISLDQNMYALSELIQWVFRSAIRNGEPIQIYIPSRRMRELFVGWLNGNY